MNELYLVRHAIAVPHGTPDIPDDQRPLTTKGRKRMRLISRGLLRLGVMPDRIVTSPLPRARETAEIVAAALGIANRLETSDSLHAGRDAASLRDWVLARGEDRLMIVGHNPGFSELLGLLATGLTDPLLCDLKKGGVAALAARADGGFALDWIAQPRLLRLMGDT
jgi:phosphohistidine phosphatase